MKNTGLFIIFCAVVILAQVFYFSGIGFDQVKYHLGWVVPLNVGLVALCLLFRTFLLFALIVSYLPFTSSGIDYEVGVVTLNPYSAGILLMALVALLKLVARHTNFQITKSDLWLSGICLSFLISTYFARDVISSGYLAFNYVFIPVVAYFVIRVMVNTEEQYDTAIKIFLITLTFFGLWTIFTYMASGRRAMPFNVYPISAATCLVVPLIYMITNKYFPRWFRWIGLAVCLVALILTFPRVYMLALLISPPIFLFIRRGKAFTVFLAFFISTILLTLILMGASIYFKPRAGYTEGVSQHTPERVTSEQNWKYSIYGRLQAYRVGLNNFINHPIFGMGLYVGNLNITQHNFNVEWLEFGGIMGYMLYVLFFLSHAWRAAPLARDDPATRTNLLILVVVMCNSLSNGMLHGLMPQVIFIVIGFTEARLRILEEKERMNAPVLNVRQHVNGKVLGMNA